MLQCTAVCRIPEIDALVFLTAMKGAPEQPVDHLSLLDEYALCELGEHAEDVEHAAFIGGAEDGSQVDLWMYWDDGLPPRFAESRSCRAVTWLISLPHSVDRCTLPPGHPPGHSWDVTDPLGDLLDEAARRAVNLLPDERADTFTGEDTDEHANGHADRHVDDRGDTP
ncbi:hypothetical protein [Streptomyces sp. NPDC060198]|uniref:hypothetical protein n=1 Tax=Streptomyces sp. NPDC060198 TaxID=3347070 RepID=UPI0036617DA1